MNEKILYTRNEAAQLLSISLRTLDGLQQRKEIQTRRVGRRVLIHRNELEKFCRRDHSGRGRTPTEPAKEANKAGLTMPRATAIKN